MIYPSIDKLLVKVGSKYLLVNIVSKRVKEMEKTEFYTFVSLNIWLRYSSKS